jgi:hypothetical protein
MGRCSLEAYTAEVAVTAWERLILTFATIMNLEGFTTVPLLTALC